jgi:hypothetical protein
MKKLFSLFSFFIFSSFVYGQKFDSQNISGDFIGLHCIGNTTSKISSGSKKYEEFILLNSKDKFGLKWRGAGKGEFIPLEGSWSFKESSIFGMGVVINNETNKGTLFSFKLNRLNGVFEESYSVSMNDKSIIEDESSGKCVRVTKFPKPIL